MSRPEPPAALARILLRWSGLVLAVIGLAAYVWYALQLPPARGVIGFAIVAGTNAYDLSLPSLGAGLILARLDHRLATTGYAIFLVALVGSVLFAGPLADWMIATPGAVKRFVLVGPAACVLVGAALVLPDTLRQWLAPLATVLTGAAFGISIRLFDPTAGDRRFIVTLTMVGLWLATVPFLLGRRQKKPWFVIATRIVGSWLIAIGMLLGALSLLPRTGPAATSSREPTSGAACGGPQVVTSVQRMPTGKGRRPVYEPPSRPHFALRDRVCARTAPPPCHC